MSTPTKKDDCCKFFLCVVVAFTVGYIGLGSVLAGSRNCTKNEMKKRAVAKKRIDLYARRARRYGTSLAMLKGRALHKVKVLPRCRKRSSFCTRRARAALKLMKKWQKRLKHLRHMCLSKAERSALRELRRSSFRFNMFGPGSVTYKSQAMVHRGRGLSGGFDAEERRDHRHRARVILKKHSITGAIPQYYVERSMRYLQRAFLYCYLQILRKRPGLKLPMQLFFKVEGNGRVSRTSMSCGRRKCPTLSKCVKRAVLASRFRLSRRGATRVSYNVIFLPPTKSSLPVRKR